MNYNKNIQNFKNRQTNFPQVSSRGSQSLMNIGDSSMYQGPYRNTDWNQAPNAPNFDLYRHECQGAEMQHRRSGSYGPRSHAHSFGNSSNPPSYEQATAQNFPTYPVPLPRYSLMHRGMPLQHQPKHHLLPHPSRRAEEYKCGMPRSLRPESLDGCNGRVRKPFVNYYRIVEELASTANFSLDGVYLARNVGANYEDLLSVTQKNCGIFQVHMDTAHKKCIIELRPKINFCEKYMKNSSCPTKQCLSVHICIDYATSVCKQKDCIDGHEWDSDHNKRVFQNFCIDKLPYNRRKGLLDQILIGAVAPKICFEYNTGVCEQGINCIELHICFEFVKSRGNCPCADLNHNIKDSECIAILKNFFIKTNDSPKEIIDNILKMSYKHSRFEKFTNNTKILSRNHSETQSKMSGNDAEAQHRLQHSTTQHNTAHTTQHSTAQHSTAQAQTSQNRTERADKPENETKETFEVKEKVFQNTTVNAWQLRGTVAIPLICVPGIDGKCKSFNTGCKYLHSKSTFQWQFGNNGSWYNFHYYHNTILEKRFRNVLSETLTLAKLKLDMVKAPMKDIFSLLGDKSIAVDFVSMSIKCESSGNSFDIRQLTTPSSVVCNNERSTMFTWYFAGAGEEWEQFGDSDFLENAYQVDPKQTILYSADNEFSYDINFSGMTQKNLSTTTTRLIRRRTAESSIKVKLEVPSEWETMRKDDIYKIVKLASSSQEYSLISRQFYLTLPMKNISSISRIQNAEIWQQFINKQKELITKYDKMNLNLNVQTLFCVLHPSMDTDIFANNIEWRVHDAVTAQPYGKGTQFYCSAAQAAADNDEWDLLVVKVILGQVTEGSSDMTRPPENPATGTLFDTTTNSRSNPTVFVKYNKQEYYPSYIINYN